MIKVNVEALGGPNTNTYNQTGQLNLLELFPFEYRVLQDKIWSYKLLPKFHERDKESLYLYLREFKEICTTVSVHNISIEQLKLKLFPFSLKRWLKCCYQC